MKKILLCLVLGVSASYAAVPPCVLGGATAVDKNRQLAPGERFAKANRAVVVNLKMRVPGKKDQFTFGECVFAEGEEGAVDEMGFLLWAKKCGNDEANRNIQITDPLPGALERFRGPKGEKGDPGPQGLQGPRGDPGPQGAAGVSVSSPAPALGKLSITPQGAKIPVGKMQNFRVVDDRGVVPCAPQWRSADPSVAAFGKMPGSNMVTTLKEGTTTISAECEGYAMATTDLFVTPVPASLPKKNAGFCHSKGCKIGIAAVVIGGGAIAGIMATRGKGKSTPSGIDPRTGLPWPPTLPPRSPAFGVRISF